MWTQKSYESRSILYAAQNDCGNKARSFYKNNIIKNTNLILKTRRMSGSKHARFGRFWKNW